MNLFFRASVEMDKLRRTTTANNAGLNAAIRKSKLQVASIHTSLDLKVCSLFL